MANWVNVVHGRIQGNELCLGEFALLAHNPIYCISYTCGAVVGCFLRMAHPRMYCRATPTNLGITDNLDSQDTSINMPVSTHSRHFAIRSNRCCLPIQKEDPGLLLERPKYLILWD